MANTLPHDTWENFQIVLPQPYCESYKVKRNNGSASSAKFQLVPAPAATAVNSTLVLNSLHNPAFSFGLLAAGDDVPNDINTPWGRARRSFHAEFSWSSSEAPTVGQLWLVIYAIFSLHPESEHFRLSLNGEGKQAVWDDLKAVGLATDHPVAESEQTPKELLVWRSMFWQGAGSPFGSTPVWLSTPSMLQSTRKSIGDFPAFPLEYTTTSKFSKQPIHARHPVRPAKPTPGSVIYSRWIPHLGEHFSMVALDYENPEHLHLFHTWQNDPRVAAGWNETGTLDQHREYLRNLHEDKHIITILARFEETFFAYFEVYWAKEDTLGAYYTAGDYDRGRHSLVGDTRFRGPHRVNAWWSGLMHYIFLSEPRTTCIVGEPRATNSRVLSYDFAHGFNLEKFVDFSHKRSAFMRCSRERFFQICPLAWEQGKSLDTERFENLKGSKI